jgi:Flp pilus assembly pilin Flp
MKLEKLRQEVEHMSENIKSEEFRISGEEVITKIKELLHEGNVRRIILKDEKGVTLIEVPLTIGVIGAVLLPVWAAIGAIAAMAAKLTLVVERTEPKEE